MSWVDVLVLFLALIAGVSGWRHGMAVALLSFVGVLGGAVLGVRIAPLLAEDVPDSATRIVISVVVVVLLVALGETTGVFLGRIIRDRFQGRASLTVDSTLGSVVQALTVVIAAWLVALPLASASMPAVAAGVKDSNVLKTVDSVMPTEARALPGSLRGLLDDSRFPKVLDSFAKTPVVAVDPPNAALADSAVVSDVRDSVLKVRGRAPSCSRLLEGSGFVVAPELVVTNAHVVAGTSETSLEVRRGRGTRTMDAQVVLYDPNVDVAVLRVPDLDAEPLSFSPETARSNDDAIIIGYPLDGPYNATAAKVRQRIPLVGPNIYDSRRVTRDVYTVRADVQSGNSGGPMIEPDGDVIGMVFGAALDDAETGFVLTAEQVQDAVEAARGRSRDVDTGACAA